MIFAYLISIYIPDSFKNDRWLLWDRRYTWTNCRRVYRDFERGYGVLRLHERTHALLLSRKFRA